MIRCTFERFFFQTVFGFYEDWREHLERDSIRSVFSLGTLCLGLFLDAIRRGALALVFFFWCLVGRERERERESYLVWLGLFVGLRGMVILLVENWNFKLERRRVFG